MIKDLRLVANAELRAETPKGDTPEDVKPDDQQQDDKQQDKQLLTHKNKNKANYVHSITM